MGTSTNAMICYGIALDDEMELPWEAAIDSDIEEWWRTLNGYIPPFELFTPEGEYIGGVEPSRERNDVYFAARRAFDAAHPLPIELEMHCSGDYPMWIVAARGTVKTAYRGSPEAFDPQALVCAPDAEVALREFCAKHLGVTDDPRWLLYSLWF